MNEPTTTQLGSYRIVERIGSGGMATVYKAYHPSTRRHVAIKILPEQMSTEAEFRRRFEQEAHVIAGLEHSHILPVHDYGQAGNLLYLVMRYIKAGTLKDRIAAGPMSLAEADRILQQVGSALDYAHRLGIVHRDVKPGNVLLDDEGSCYLTDFGLAKILESSTQLTGSGVGVGTPAYMSPEQGQGENADARSDIYSLGVMLYEMIAGRAPYQAETPLAVVLMHITAPLPPLRTLRPEVPEAVEQVVFKAMAKDPAGRYQTVREMMEAFSNAVAASAQTLPPGQAIPNGTRALRASGERAASSSPPAAKRFAFAATGWIWAAAGVGALSLLCIAALILTLAFSPIRVRVQDGQFQLVRVPRNNPAAATATTSLAASTSTATADLPTATAAPAAALAQVTPTRAAPAMAAPTATSTPDKPAGPTATPSPSPAPWTSAFVPLTELDKGGEVAFSPDGRLLAIAGNEATLYDTTTWQVVRTLPGVQDAAGLSFSPDGAILAVIGRQLTLFEVATGAERYTIPNLEFNTSARSSYFISFSPDGETLAVIVDDVIKLYATADGRETGMILAQGSYAIAIAPDGQTLATAGWSSGVRLWDLATGQEKHVLGEEQHYTADRVAFTPDGSKLISAGSGSPLMVWAVDSGRSLGSWSGYKVKINALAFSADSRLLITASEDVTARVWDVDTGRELQVLIGHTRPVIGAALSPDGMLLVTSAYETSRVWSFSPQGATPTPAPMPADAGPRHTPVPLSAHAISAENASQVVQISQLEQAGAQAAWSPDGKLLAVAQHEVTLYDTATWQIVRTIPLQNWVYGIGFSPDGASLAVLDGECHMFEVATGAEQVTLPNVRVSTSAASGYFMSFSPDGSLFATVVDEVVKIYRTQTWDEAGILLAGGVDALTFAPDGRTLATAGWSGGVRLWDITTGQQVGAFGEGQISAAERVVFSPDGTQLVAKGVGSDPIMVWEVATGRSLGSLSGHTGRISTLAFSPDGQLLVTASDDVTVRIWDMATRRELKSLIGHTQGVTSAAFSPDGATLVTTSDDGTTRLWAASTTGDEPGAGLARVTPGPTMTSVPLAASAISLQNASQVSQQQVLEREGNVALFSPDGKLLAVAKREVTLYDTTSWQVVRTIALDDWVSGLEFSPDGASLAVLNYQYRIFDVATGAEKLTLPNADVSTSAASSYFISFSPDGSLFAAVIDEVVKLYETQTWHEVGILLVGGPNAIAFAPDGRILATAGWSEGVKLWDVTTGLQVRALGEGQMHGAERVAFSPDGSRLAASGVSEHTVAIWAPDTGRSLTSLSGHTDRVNALSFSPDGQLLVTASSDLTVRIWDVAAGRELESLIGHTADILSVAFSPDGALLVTTSQDGTIRLWSVQ